MDCSGFSIPGSYVYSVSMPAPVGTIMSVSCPEAEAWSFAPVYSARNATCTNVSNTGEWVLSNSDSCVGKSMTIDQYSHN